MAHKPIITFLSDFGTQDGYTGAVKGVLKSYSDAIDIIDITHEIESFNIKKAAFTILNYYSQYPKGTVHLAVVDPGVGSERNIVIVKTDNYHLIGPDNGIFQYILQQDNYKIFRVDPESIYKNETGATFHARDIFAPIAARIVLGERAENIGTQLDKLEYANQARKKISNKLLRIEIEIIACDKFGNIIFDYTEIDRRADINHQISTIRFKNFESDQIYDYYSQVTKGNPLFLWNSQGFMELAIYEGNAKDFFKSSKKDKATIIFKS